MGKATKLIQTENFLNLNINQAQYQRRANQERYDSFVLRKKNPPTFTQHVDPHAESALPCPVPGHALVDSGVVHGDDLDDEGVQGLLTHQHLVVVVWTDGFPVQVPADVGRRETSHLDLGGGGGGRGG